MIEIGPELAGVLKTLFICVAAAVIYGALFWSLGSRD